MPIYLLAGILLTFVFFVALIPFAVILYASGVPIERGNEAAFMNGASFFFIVDRKSVV